MEDAAVKNHIQDDRQRDSHHEGEEYPDAVQVSENGITKR
jgi:hypothetical protein